MLSVDAARLDLVLVTDSREVGLRVGVGDLHVHAGPHASTEVGGAARQVAKLLRVLEPKTLVQLVHRTAQPTEHRPDVAALLHADDAEVVLLVQPHKESLVLVVEDATTLRPLLIHSSCFEEAVSFLEQEVVGHKLQTSGFVHALKRVVVSGQVSFQGFQHFHHLTLNLQTILLPQVGGQTVALQVASHTNTGGADVLALGVQVGGVHLAGVHVGLVLLGQLVGVVVLLHNWGEQGAKQGVALLISSVDTDARIQVHYTGVDAVLKGSATGSLLVLQLFKYLASEVLLQCGFDLWAVQGTWELAWSRHYNEDLHNRDTANNPICTQGTCKSTPLSWCRRLQGPVK